MKLTIDKLGRIVVPKALRDRFALVAGDELEVMLEADGFRLRPSMETPALKEEDGLLVCDCEVPVSAWDIGAFMESEREQRSSQLGGM